MNFNLEMEKRQEKITGILEYYLPKEEGFQKTVLEAMNYSMRAGGSDTYTQIVSPFLTCPVCVIFLPCTSAV